MTGYFNAAPRPLHPGDAPAARALVLGSLGATPYVDRVLELLDQAIAWHPEPRGGGGGLLIERDGTAAALALFGPVEGSIAWRLDAVLIAPDVELREIGGIILDAVADQVRQGGGSLLVAELPADAAVGRSITLLRANGFRQEGRIPDYFRDGVALLFLRRAL
ncbi:MAG: hypothetical protein WD801_15825 [Gemmatimonadaceae bacterium]